jgi:hypothetical protein
MMRQIESSDEESESGKSKDNQRLKEVSSKEDDRAPKASRSKVTSENEDTDPWPSKWGFSSHQSSKKISCGASQKVYVPPKI